MKLLVFEWLSGGGLWLSHESVDPTDPFQKQGQGMLSALVADLMKLGIEVHAPIDSRVNLEKKLAQELFKPTSISSASNLESVMLELSELCDQIILIAPECDDCLADCCRWVDAEKDKLISPDIEFIRLASDKQLTIERLQRAQVSVPRGTRLSDFDPKADADLIGLPAVLKPVDGAGSEHVQLIEDWSDLPALQSAIEIPNRWRLESFVDGVPVSVSACCGPSGYCLFPATRQLFDAQPFGNYIGTDYPLSKEIAEVARELARDVMKAMPGTKGYIGIDMIIDSKKLAGVVLEVNPRLTMSYVKLSKALGVEIAEFMLKHAIGDDWRNIS